MPVIPAQAGIQLARDARNKKLDPAFLPPPKRSRFGFAQAGAGLTRVLDGGDYLGGRLPGHDKGPGNDYASRRKVENVPGHYTVGLVAKGKADRVAVDAEDALIAALKVKTEHPDATITYVRRQNRRGDARHPSHSLTGNRR